MEQIRRMSSSDTYVTDSYPEPYEFNFHPRSYSLKSILIQYFHLSSGLSYPLLPSEFLTKIDTLFIIFESIRPSCGPGSSVSIATDYGLDGPGSNPGEDEFFRTGPDRPTQPPVKWLPGLSRG